MNGIRDRTKMGGRRGGDSADGARPKGIKVET